MQSNQRETTSQPANARRASFKTTLQRQAETYPQHPKMSLKPQTIRDLVTNPASFVHLLTQDRLTGALSGGVKYGVGRRDDGIRWSLASGVI